VAWRTRLWAPSQPDEPRRVEDLLAPVGVAQRRADGLGRLGHRDEPGVALDRDPQAAEQPFQDRLGDVLPEGYRPGKGRVHFAEAGVQEPRSLDAGTDDLVDDTQVLEDLERPRVHHRGARVRVDARAFVDDPDRHAVARQLAGHAQTRGPTADDEDWVG
jgi:hypothetical protein